jgi:hypothetical protein
MLKNIIVILIAVLGIFLPISSVMAQMDCSPLDPRANLSREMDGKINVSANTLFKIGKVDGSIEGRMKDEIQNLQKGAPATEQGQIKLRTLYIFCGMVANAKDISTERKVELYKVMMDIKNTNEPKSKQPTQKKKKVSSPSNNVPRKKDDEQREIVVAKQVDPKQNISVTSHGQTGGITAQNVTINKVDNEHKLSKLHELNFATMIVEVRSNIFSYYLFDSLLYQEITIINKTPFDWRDITLTTYSLWILNHNIDLNNSDSYMQTAKQYISLIEAGGR